MDFIFLVVMLIITLIVFGVDASQKRRQYLDKQEI
jgi:hypothetical protein